MSKTTVIQYDRKSGNDIYDILRPILTVTMFLGMTPVANVRSASSRNVSFHWCCWQTAYSMAVVVCMLFATYIMLTSYTYILSNLLDINEVALCLTGPIFYISNTTSLIQLITVTRRLPKLLASWDKVARKLQKLVGGHRRPTLILYPDRKVIVGFAAIMGVSSVIEHVLHDMNLPLHLCPKHNGTFFQCYMVRGNKNFNDTFGHSNALSVIFWIIQKYANFAWHFHDIFLVVLAMAVRQNFKVLADYMRRTYKEIKTPHQWKHLRKSHLIIVDLMQSLDKAILFMVLQSYTVNMFYICIQVSLLLRPIERTTVQMIYFAYSMCHLITRMCTVTASAAAINEQAKRPLRYLIDCPDATYCTEVDRFIQHLINIPMGLTGCKFFVVDRNIFLVFIKVAYGYVIYSVKIGGHGIQLLPSTLNNKTQID